MLFNPNTLAPEYPESAITRPFPFNGYYAEDEAPEVDGKTYKLEVGGMIDNKEPWTLDRLYALPQVSQITRHVCVEGWSAIGSWQGVRLSEFLKRIGADTRAKYVWFQCAEGYSNTIDMATALHPQTQLSFKFDNQILPRKYGFPMKCRMPDQARLQESEIHHGDLRAEQRRRRLLGEPGLQLVQRALAHQDQHHAADRQRGAGDQPERDLDVAEEEHAQPDREQRIGCVQRRDQ